MFLALAKGQEELKALINKEKKKKAKKSDDVLNMGRRLRGPAKRALNLTTPSNERDNHEEDNNPGTDEDEDDYFEEKYPLTGQIQTTGGSSQCYGDSADTWLGL